MIRPLDDDEFAEAAALAAAAYREDPGFAHILPDDTHRRLRLPSFLEALLRVDSTNGGLVSGAFEDDAMIGISSVIRAGIENPGIPDWIKHLPSLAWLWTEPAALLRAMSLTRALEEQRPKDCDYLHFLAVHPATQGRGVGAALLNAAIKQTVGPLYLESFTTSSVAWCEERGFKPLLEVRSPARAPFWTLRRTCNHP